MAKRNKLLSLVMALVMVFTLLPVTAGAEEPQAEPSIIEIADADDLIALSTGDFTEISEATIRLTQDIDMAGQSAISPIGDGEAFNGTFDGQGYVIRNLKITSKSTAAGLFGQVGPQGVVCDLGLENITVIGGDESGTTGTNTGTIAGALLGTVSRCAVTGSVKGWRYSGGIAGMLYGGTIENCWVNLAMDGSRYFGGLFGGTRFDTEYSGSNQSLFAEAPTTKNKMTVRNNLVMGTIYSHVRSAGLVGTMDHVDSRPLAAFEGNVSRIDSLELERQEPGENYYGPLYANWSTEVTTAAGAPNNLYSEDISYIYKGSVLAATDTKTEWLSNQAAASAEKLADQATYEALGWDFDNTWYWDEERNQPMLQGMEFYKENKVRTVYVEDAQDFLALCDPLIFNELSNDIIILTNDIDMGKENAISPIGGNLPFNGTFNGRGHAIKNLTITGVAGTNKCTGLFGYVGTEGKIINLGLDCVNVSGDVNTGAFAGCLTGSVTQCFVTGAVKGKRFTGGVAGMLHAGTIENCWTDLVLTGSRYCGGLFGSSNYNNANGSPLTSKITNKPMIIRNNLILGTISANRYSSGVLGHMGSANASPLSSFEGNVVWADSISALIDCQEQATSGKDYYGPVFALWSKSRDAEPPINADNLYCSEMSVSHAVAGVPSYSITDSVSYDTLRIKAETEENLNKQETYENLNWDFGEADGIWVWSNKLGHPVLQGQTVPADPDDAKKYPASVVTTYVDSPKTTRAFTWNTINTIEDTIVQAVPADSYNKTNPRFTISETGSSYELKDKNNASTSRNIHKVNLTGLEPGTTYYYRVGDGEYWSSVYSFTTEQEDADSFTFFNITDTQDQQANSSDYDNYANALEHATNTYPEGAFIVHTGDVIQQNSSADYDEVYRVTSDYVTSLPSMVAPGNHELKKDDKYHSGPFDPVLGINNFKAHYQFPDNGPEGYEQTVYSFTYGDAYFAILNSNVVFKDYSSDPDHTDYTAQIEWLKEDIAKNGADKAWKIVALHHGPYSYNGTIASDADSALVAALEEAEVDLVLFGHYHYFLCSQPILRGEVTTDGNGIVYYSAGATNTNASSVSKKTNKIFDINTTNTANGAVYAAITITEDKLILNSHSVPKQGTQVSTVLNTMEISKPDASIATAPTAVEGLTYTGTEQVLVTAGSSINGTILYSLDGKTYSKKLPAATDAGIYTVYYKVGGLDYSDTTPQFFNVTIAPKAISGAAITLGEALTYTGSEQTQDVISVKVGGLDVTYDVSGNKGTTVGDYILTVTGTGNFTGTATAGWSIAAAPSGGSSGGAHVPTYPPIIEDTDNGDVTINNRNPEKGDKVTFTPDPDEGFAADDVVVTDKNGNKVDVTDNGDGSYTYVQPSGRVTIEVIFEELIPLDNCPKDESCPIHPYVDADAAAWYHDGVHYCLAAGLMNGKTATTFEPNSNITRQQIWMILARLSGETPDNMTEARTWAVENGVSDGTNPGNLITRQQLAAMLYRYAQLKGYDVSVGENTNILSYEDVARVSEYAIPAMQWSCGSGVVGGYADGTLRPLNNATRAHAAVMFQRFCENVVR